MKSSNQTLIKTTIAGIIILMGFLSGFIYGKFDQQHLANASSAQKTPLKPLDTFATVLNKIKLDYYDQSVINEAELTYSAIQGMLGGLGDPFTRFMTPKDYEQMQESTRGDFVGIGAQLESDPLGAVVKKPIKNSPAEKKGLKSNDTIIKVDGKVLAGMEIDAIVKMIRGERYKPVTLTIIRKGSEEPIDITIVRDRIISPNIEVFMEDEEAKIGRIWLGEFNEMAPAQIDQGLRELEREGLKGLILDLRFNPGGLLPSAIEIASRFQNKGPVLIIRQRDGSEDKPGPITALYHKHSYPIVVLVNGSSASASEIVTGCLKDYSVATIIGEKTFGKGLVQTVMQLRGGTAVAITTAKYYTPKGTDINRKKTPSGKYEGGGIIPDFEVKPADDWQFNNEKGDENDLQLKKAIEVLKEKIK